MEVLVAVMVKSVMGCVVMLCVMIYCGWKEGWLVGWLFLKETLLIHSEIDWMRYSCSSWLRLFPLSPVFLYLCKSWESCSSCNSCSIGSLYSTGTACTDDPTESPEIFNIILHSYSLETWENFQSAPQITALPYSCKSHNLEARFWVLFNSLNLVNTEAYVISCGLNI